MEAQKPDVPPHLPHAHSLLICFYSHLLEPLHSPSRSYLTPPKSLPALVDRTSPQPSIFSQEDICPPFCQPTSLPSLLPPRASSLRHSRGDGSGGLPPASQLKRPYSSRGGKRQPSGKLGCYATPHDCCRPLQREPGQSMLLPCRGTVKLPYCATCTVHVPCSARLLPCSFSLCSMCLKQMMLLHTQ